MDPQQRLLLEVGWSALEDAGLAPDRLSGESIGVYVGVGANEYALRMGDPSEIDGHMLTGNALSVAAGRVSYSLGLRGPSVAVDTACSSSLVAVHLACQALRQGECRMALAGGVNVLLSPLSTMALADLNALASDGHCKTFDASADGYVRGEGCGLVVLKRLSDAVQDGDLILAVVRGSAVNQDGRSASLTAPSGPAQEAVIRSALATAGIEPDRVGYVEAHGTGTSLGDPIELRALAGVLGEGRDRSRPFLVGSVKTNVGHLEAAAGVAGLIKAVLCIQHGQIPAHRNYRQLNTHLNADELPLTIPTAAVGWPSDGRPRVAGVSSFGFSGTNVHIVLEEAPAGPAAASDAPSRPRNLLLLAARSDEALKSMAARLSVAMASNSSLLMDDICSASARRSQFSDRIAVVAESREKLATMLDDFATGKGSSPGVIVGRAEGRPRVAFLCPGQGTQYPGMGLDLLDHCPAFRDAFRVCEEILKPLLGLRLVDVLRSKDADPHPLERTAIAQPALVAIGWASAAAWRSFGIVPDAVMGHSLGEITASALAGVLSIEDALRLAVARGRLMEDLPTRGVMAAVSAGPLAVAGVLAKCGPGVEVAAWNGPQQTVIAGPEASVVVAEAELRRAGLGSSRLPGRHAFHTAAIEPALVGLREAASRLRHGRPKIRLVSNLSGGEVPGLEPGHWASHARNPVRFVEGLATLEALGTNAYIELGPGSTLLGLAKRGGVGGVQTPTTRRGASEWGTLLEGVARLFAAGAEIDREGIDGGLLGSLNVSLPTYPFRGERFWLDPVVWSPRPIEHSIVSKHHHSLAGTKVRSAGRERVREYDFGVDLLPFLGDHRVFGRVVVPGACHLALALEAGSEVDSPGRVLEDVVFPSALVLPETGTRTVQQVVRPGLDGKPSFQVFSLDDREPGELEESWTLHATGILIEGQSVDKSTIVDSVESLQSRSGDEASVDDFYRQVADRGVALGPDFRWIGRLWRGAREALSRMRDPRNPDETQLFPIHPGLLDSCIQLVVAAFPDVEAADDPYIPVGLRRLRYLGRSKGPLWGHSRLLEGSEAGGDSFSGDLRLFDESGRIVIEFDGLQFRRASRAAFLRSVEPRQVDPLYELAWRPLVLPSDRPAATARWLILADSDGVADGLAARLREAGDSCVLIGNRSEMSKSGDQQIDPTRPEEVDRLVREVLDEGPCRGVVDLWPLDARGDEFEGSQDLGCRSALPLIQALGRSVAGRAPRLWLVTRGAQEVADDLGTPDPSQAALWGLARVAMLEHPELRCSLLDLEAAGPTSEVEALADEIRAEDCEDQVAIRGGRRFVARLARPRPPVEPIEPIEPRGGQPFRFRIETPGVLDSLAPVPMEPIPPGPGQVQIRVAFAGINFRDVLSGLGLYPGDPGPLGAECSGTVIAVGEGVEGLSVGDEVLALAPGSLASDATVDARLVARRPSRISLAQAAAIPVAFLTADLALFRLAGLQAGQTILIHAATGGLGLAALELARRAGLVVLATAGSPAKRSMLRKLGVAHIFDSRSVGFASLALEATGGRGVDAVLNSLSGDLIAEGLAALAPGGHFLEVGKIGIWDSEQVAQSRPDISYHTIALDALGRDDPGLVGGWLTDLMGRFEAGALIPVMTSAVGASEASGALRRMAQARHMGKLAVRVGPSGSAWSIRSDATYLVTGGLGGLGLQVAGWLASRGAKNLVLAGRRGLEGSGAEALAEVNRLQASGVRVLAVSADVSTSGGVAGLLAAIEGSGMPPLRGLIHAAGVLDDGALSGQDWSRFDRVLGPKAGGAWHLHRATSDLDFFVMFGSAAGLLGSAGQGSYAAGNAYLDGLASHRRGLGLPATSLAWGPWEGAGMAAQLGEAERNRWSQKGLGLIEPKAGLEILGRVLDRGDVRVAVLPIDWPRYLRGSGGPLPPLLGELTAGASEARETEIAGTPFLDLWRACDASSRRRISIGYVRDQVVRVLGLDPSHPLGGMQPLNEVGLDSLLAVELRSVLAAGTGLALPATLLFNYPSVEALAEYLEAELSVLESSNIADSSAEIDDEADRLARAREEVELLSEDELDGLLSGFAAEHLKDLDRA